MGYHLYKDSPPHVSFPCSRNSTVPTSLFVLLMQHMTIAYVIVVPLPVTSSLFVVVQCRIASRLSRSQRQTPLKRNFLLLPLLPSKPSFYVQSSMNSGTSNSYHPPIMRTKCQPSRLLMQKLPPELPRHTDIQHFAICGDSSMCHIPTEINPADDLTKPLEWVLSAHLFYSTMLNRGGCWATNGHADKPLVTLKISSHLDPFGRFEF